MYKAVSKKPANLLVNISKTIPINFEHFVSYNNILTESYINNELNLWMQKSYEIKNRELTNEKIVYFINKPNAKIYKSLSTLLKNNKSVLKKSIELYNN